MWFTDRSTDQRQCSNTFVSDENSFQTTFILICSGYHVNLIQRNNETVDSTDRSLNASNDGKNFRSKNQKNSKCERLDPKEKDDSINYSMLTAADNGRAQFIGVSIETFSIRSAISAQGSVVQNNNEFFSKALLLEHNFQLNLHQHLHHINRKRAREKVRNVVFRIDLKISFVDKINKSAIVFIIDDITDPVPFNKTLDSVYVPVQLS